jgi:hypothetical protein
MLMLCTFFNFLFFQFSLFLKQVLDVLRVEDKTFSVSLSMYFGVYWTEGRLKIPPIGTNNTWLPIDLVRNFFFSSITKNLDSKEIFNLMSVEVLLLTIG